MLTGQLLGFSVPLTIVVLAGFRLGLAIQDRQATFNGAILVFLVALIGAFLVVRARS